MKIADDFLGAAVTVREELEQRCVKDCERRFSVLRGRDEKQRSQIFKKMFGFSGDGLQELSTKVGRKA